MPDFEELKAYYRLEPCGPERGDLQAGIVVDGVGQMFKKLLGIQQLPKLADYVVRFLTPAMRGREAARGRQTVEDMKAVARRQARRSGGEVR